MNIHGKYHLLAVALAFLLFMLIILTDTYSFFLKDQLYEGFVVVVPVVVFCVVGLFLTIPFLFKQDFKNLALIAPFYVATGIAGFQDFHLSLLLLPLILAVGSGVAFWRALKHDQKGSEVISIGDRSS